VSPSGLAHSVAWELSSPASRSSRRQAEKSRSSLQMLGHTGRHERPGRDPPEHVVVPREQLAQLGADVGFGELWHHRARANRIQSARQCQERAGPTSRNSVRRGSSPRTPAALRRPLCRGSGAPMCVPAPTVKPERVRSCRGPLGAPKGLHIADSGAPGHPAEPGYEGGPCRPPRSPKHDWRARDTA
jgi:hypothetical protein